MRIFMLALVVVLGLITYVRVVTLLPRLIMGK